MSTATITPTDLTDAERKCLKAVVEAGSVVMQKGSFDLRGLAAGEMLPHATGTYLLLVGKRMLEFAPGDCRRLQPTPAGTEEAARYPAAPARRKRA
ncbi:hypothetical protein [Azospirillum sp.]|uniref:hypothetical protein n=1 Tax=Azospirillum sp. TaxID=34012 RepID=UPI003D732A00